MSIEEKKTVKAKFEAEFFGRKVSKEIDLSDVILMVSNESIQLDELIAKLFDLVKVKPK